MAWNRCPVGRLVLLAPLLSGGCQVSSPASEQYLLRLEQQIKQVEPLGWTASAESTAERLMAGGQLWATGPQAGFAVEAFNRAGGLSGLRMLEQETARPGDVVLCAFVGPPSDDLGRRIETWRRDGVQVVTFMGPSTPAGMPVRDRGVERLCPTDTLLNVVNMWVWTGEVVAACTRRGRMPVLYQSYGIEGGRPRGQKYSGQTFHQDMTIAPIPPGLLGRRYVDAVSRILDQVREQELAQLRRIAAAWRAAPPESCVVLTLGHLYPGHFEDSRAPQRGTFNPKTALSGSESFVLHVGYQLPPEDLIQQAQSAEVPMAYLSVQPAEPAVPSKHLLHVDPHWPLDDACVSVAGYDIPILPSSGVVNAAIYWAVLAEACDVR